MGVDPSKRKNFGLTFQVHFIPKSPKLHAPFRSGPFRDPQDAFCGSAVLRDEGCNWGFLHRLDVPNSGLLLVAKSYRAYYELQPGLDMVVVVNA